VNRIPAGSLALSIVCALGLGCAAEAAAPGRSRLDTERVELAFDRSAGFVAVRTMINGWGPFWFNIDTYASIHACVDHTLARELQLPKTDTTLNSDGSGNTVERDIVTIDEIRLGGAVFEGTRALVDDYSWVKAPDGSAVRGLLGFELFKKLLLTIDYPESRIVLERGRLSRKSEDVIRYVDPRGVPDIAVEVGDTPLLVGIDSGGKVGLFLGRPQVEQLEIEGTPTLSGQTRSVYATADIYTVRAQGELKLAGHRHHPLDITFTDADRHGLIGYDLLQFYAITFDQRHNLVRFSEPGVKSWLSPRPDNPGAKPRLDPSSG